MAEMKGRGRSLRAIAAEMRAKGGIRSATLAYRAL
jgi:hypothetical protein